MGQPKILLFLFDLHGEKSSDLDILNYFGRNVVLVSFEKWLLRNELGEYFYIIIAQQFAESFLNVHSSGVASLKAFDAYLGHAKRQYFNLLKSTVNNDSSVDANSIERHRVGQD